MYTDEELFEEYQYDIPTLKILYKHIDPYDLDNILKDGKTEIANLLDLPFYPYEDEVEEFFCEELYKEICDNCCWMDERYHNLHWLPFEFSQTTPQDILEMNLQYQPFKEWYTHYRQTQELNALLYREKKLTERVNNLEATVKKILEQEKRLCS